MHAIRCAILERRARQRALRLGFVPNEDLDDLPINHADGAGDDGLSTLEDAHPAGGMVTHAYLRWLRERGADLLAARSPAELAALELSGGGPSSSALLIKGTAFYNKQLRLHPDESTNAQMAMLLEADAPAEARVSPSQLGGALIACHFQSIARLLRPYPSMRPLSGAPRERASSNLVAFAAPRESL